MKQVEGIWLPDGDRHFADYLHKSVKIDGTGTYQLDKSRKAIATAKWRRVALDIGAHVGLWSRILAKEFETVIAFEPLPNFCVCFRKNTAGFSNVKLIEAAASHQNGETVVQAVADNSGQSFVAPLPHDASMQAVKAVRIDDLGLEKIDLVKIDVEGWELMVLLGAQKTIQRDRPTVVIEQKPNNAERYGLDRYAASELLIAWGARQLWEKAQDHCFGWKNDT